MKNTCGKTRPITNPYEVWQAGGWKWLVLKKYQADDFKPYARAFCAVSSPTTRAQMSSGYELGDVYLSEIRANAVKTSENK
jgi:hypothetical protein